MSKSTVMKALSALLVVVVMVLIYADAVLRSKFEGNRWIVPAKVYSLAMELYPGKAVTAQHIIFLLKKSGYIEKEILSRPGEFSYKNNEINVYRRYFDHARKSEPALKLRLKFRGDRLKSIHSEDKALSLARLEPVVIGGIYPSHKEDRILLKREDIPQTLVDALIITEDKDFYRHWGVSLRGIMRAVFTNVKSGGFVQGGSTLTQQLVKNYFLTSERTLRRKLAEVVMSFMLELHYEKDEILEAYTNEIYLGQSGSIAIHGFGLAAHHYFGSSLRELSIDQLCLLVAIVKGPSYFNPFTHEDRALQRRNIVIDLMADNNLIDKSTARHAKNAPLGLSHASYSAYQYPAFMGLVKSRLREKYRLPALAGSGARIFTTLDPYVQTQAEDALMEHLKILNAGRPAGAKLQGSVVVLEPQTGDILAMVSDRNPGAAGFNRALHAYRPVGSLMKPFVYLAAIQKGLSWQSAISDAPLSVELPNGLWQPENFSKQSHGKEPDYLVPMLDGLKHSYNLATARLAMEIGLDNVVNNLHALGFSREVEAYPSLALGAVDMSAFEVAGLYQVISAQGFRSEPKSLREIVDGEGNFVELYKFDVEQSLPVEQAYLLTWGMQKVAKGGTGKRMYDFIDRKVHAAGKTGTSDEGRDGWFVGFTGNYLAVVWVGNDENKAAGITGGSAALPVWSQLMSRLSVEPLNPNIPEEVESRWVSKDGYKLSAAHCQGSIEIPVIKDSLDGYQKGCGKASVKINKAQNWFRGLFK